MKEVIEWVLKNATITCNRSDLIVGNVNGKYFRIYPTEGWAGVRNEHSFENAIECLDINEFLDAIQSTSL